MNSIDNVENSPSPRLKTQFTNNTALEELNLSSNDFEGAIPDLSINPKLRMVHLGSNRFNGALPDFSSNQKLETLDVSNNQCRAS